MSNPTVISSLLLQISPYYGAMTMKKYVELVQEELFQRDQLDPSCDFFQNMIRYNHRLIIHFICLSYLSSKL
jgi:hypothetical protein